VRRGAVLAGGLAALLLAAPATAQDELIKTSGSAVDVVTRPGITVRYMMFKPAAERPKAAVVLFTGGYGFLNMPDKVGATWQASGNFLPRSREHFLRRDFLVVVVNPPSDQPKGYVMFRTTAAHAEDIAAVISDVRRRARHAQVWLIGTSRGTVSVANVASRLQGERAPDGIVLTSSVTRTEVSRTAPPDAVQTVYDSDLKAIRVPALVVHHRQDGCSATPSIDAPALLAKLSNAPRKELLIFDGGSLGTDQCSGNSPHGFLDIERQVVDAIADWMGATPKPDRRGS